MTPSDRLFLALSAAAAWPVVWGTAVVWFARGRLDRRAGRAPASVFRCFGVALLWTCTTLLTAAPTSCAFAVFLASTLRGTTTAGAQEFLCTAGALALAHLIATPGAAALLPYGRGPRDGGAWAVCWAAAGAWVAGAAPVVLPTLHWLNGVLAGC